MCQYARPVNGVHGTQVVVPLKCHVVEKLLEHPLAIVEGALDGDAVDIGVWHTRHLPFLQGGDAPFGEHNENVDTSLAAHTVNSRAARVTAGGADDVQLALRACQ